MSVCQQNLRHTIHLTWPFISRLYFCILCNKNGIKGLWGHKGPPSLGLGPALVLQWTLPWPYNTHDMVLYIWAILLHSMQQKWDQRTLGTRRSTLIGSRTHHGPSMDPAIGLQYTWHGPTIHPTWPNLYWLYFCIQCHKNGIKGLWGHTGWPP